MPTTRINGIELAYTDTGVPPGRPDAATVVFGHGLLFSGWMFRPQIAVLRERYRCVAVDFRGHGDTPATRSDYDMDTLTADVTELIEHLDVGPVHYVGLSMGGFVGQRIAARHGQLLRSLTLLDTSGDVEDPDRVGRYKLLALIYRLIGMAPVRNQAVSLLFGPTFRASTASKPVIEEWARRVRGYERAGIYRAILAVAERSSVLAELSRITVPTLVIVGADDEDTPPEQSRKITRSIRGARLEVVLDCGHTSTLEQPEVIAALIQQFLTASENDERTSA
ncbi:alpha/beta fold hydrolase [Nocardia sp. NPDC055029]